LHCEEALLLISGHMDNENTESEEARLQEHLQGCESCRQVLESFQMADLGLLSLTEEAPQNLSDRVMEAIRSQAKPGKRHNPWISVMASAAAVALVVGLGWFALPKPAADDPADPVVVSHYAKDIQVQNLRAYSSDVEAVSQEIGAPVVVLDAFVEELEGLPFELFSDGSRLYTLQTASAAQELSQRYGCALYLPESNSVTATNPCSYAFVPATP